MSRFLSTILAIVLISCTNKQSVNPRQDIIHDTKIISLSLSDSLGKVYLTLPNRYDTSVKWVHFGDCGRPCNYQKYMYQPKAVPLPLQLENGMYWRDSSEVIDRFTIEHRQQQVNEYNGNPKHLLQWTKALGQEDALAVRVNDSIQLRIVFDTLQTIDDRPFAMVAYEGYNMKTKQYRCFLLGQTTLGQDYLRFAFHRKNKQSQDTSQKFLEQSKRMLEQIRIESGI
jgi:hypothetical protein